MRYLSLKHFVAATMHPGQVDHRLLGWREGWGNRGAACISEQAQDFVGKQVGVLNLGGFFFGVRMVGMAEKMTHTRISELDSLGIQEAKNSSG
jgi:hypothetical protein